MDNSNLKKQAKSDIFKALRPIILFYIKKGAKPKSLKKYYNNNKRFRELLSDIKNKGIKLVENEDDYKKIVKSTLHEILDDVVAKEKDTEYNSKTTTQKNCKDTKLKHIKEFNSYENDEYFYIKKDNE